MKARTGTTESTRQGSLAIPPRFFTLIPAHTTIDFVGLSPKMALLSCALILIGFVSMVLHGGFNYGIDFTGGTMLDVRFARPIAIADLRAALDRPDLNSISVQDVGGSGAQFQIVARQGSDETGSVVTALKNGLTQRFGEGSYEVLRAENVGPKVGQDLWREATLAVLAATVIMGIYIAVRFDLPIGVGAAVKLVHDVLITLGAISLASMEFDLSTVAALLTVVGFSVNDDCHHL